MGQRIIHITQRGSRCRVDVAKGIEALCNYGCGSVFDQHFGIAQNQLQRSTEIVPQFG
jgi:hypothetical protein